MFISTLDLFKVGIGPSSSHTMGPMLAAYEFASLCEQFQFSPQSNYKLQCLLKGSLAFTGKGHSTDKAVLLGLHGFLPQQLTHIDIDELVAEKMGLTHLNIKKTALSFKFTDDLIFDYKDTLDEHPNGLVFNVIDDQQSIVLSETYFSIGGGFIHTQYALKGLLTADTTKAQHSFSYGFSSADEMLSFAEKNSLTIAQMKHENECQRMTNIELNDGLDGLWQNMQECVKNGLKAEGVLPGGLFVERRAKNIHTKLLDNPDAYNVNDWLCAYAMAVNEENAAGHMVVTAPTNGAAGVIPAVLYYAVEHSSKTQDDVRQYLLTAAAIGGLIKHNSSISGAEVGCQGEVGSASAMAAAGLCAINGGSPQQVENAAEIALEHHLGMTCDPVKGLVQIPCIERNGFGAIKAFTAASLALHGNGSHIMSLDRCIRAMKRTGEEMSYKYKETSLGGLAVSNIEC